jgi:hypothetical protein
MATVAAESPRPASIWANNPPVECPITAGFFSSLPITSAVWSATCFSVLLARTSGFPDRVWAVEGWSGKPVAHRLVHDGEVVVDVPAKLSAQVRVFATGNGGKTDPVHAHSVAMVALWTANLVRG